MLGLHLVLVTLYGWFKSSNEHDQTRLVTLNLIFSVVILKTYPVIVAIINTLHMMLLVMSLCSS